MCPFSGQICVCVYVCSTKYVIVLEICGLKNWRIIHIYISSYAQKTTVFGMRDMASCMVWDVESRMMRETSFLHDASSWTHVQCGTQIHVWCMTRIYWWYVKWRDSWCQTWINGCGRHWVMGSARHSSRAWHQTKLRGFYKTSADVMTVSH